MTRQDPPASEAVVEPIAGHLDDARAVGASVLFTRDVHPPEQFADAHYYEEFDRWGEHVLEGSREAEIVEDAVGYIGGDHHEYALEHADRLFGETTTVDAIEFG